MENLCYEELTNLGKKVYDIITDFKENKAKKISYRKQKIDKNKIKEILRDLYEEMKNDYNNKLITLETKNIFVYEMNEILKEYKDYNLFEEFEILKKE